MFERSGAELIIDILVQHGVRQIAGIPGGFNLPLYDAMARDGRIAHILARHEQGAGFIAQGMARSTGEVAVCFATSGPGATNVLTALADAKLDSVPIICITGQVPTDMIGTDAFQEVDIVAAAAPITKRSIRISGATQLLTAIPDAFFDARDGKPGPILIDVPRDVQLERITIPRLPDIRPRRTCSVTGKMAEQLDKAARLIDEAKSPILYLGGGVRHAHGATEACQLAQKGALPTVCTLMALGAMPTSHPMYMGMAGMHGDVHTNLAMARCDLLIAVGTRFGDRATGRLEQFCANARLIHIDIAEAELNRLKRGDIAILGDAGPTLAYLKRRISPRRRSAWFFEIDTLRQAAKSQNPGAASPISQWPADVISGVSAHCGDAFITTDVGQHQMWTARTFPFSFNRQWLTSGGLGTMGFGLPAAIGVALRHPTRQVVCFSGDGSIMMNIQELALLAEHRLNVKIVLFNNWALGLVAQQQDLFYDQRRYACEFDHSPCFETIAAGFGIRCIHITCDADLSERMPEVFRTEGPCLIHVPVDSRARVLPMVPPGSANTEMITADYPLMESKKKKMAIG
jgi:acetolactate synthase I/II/III large subunit